jgi:ankyrin repeat protein
MLSVANSEAESSIQVTEMLIKAGADINLINCDNHTALMLAIKFCNTSSSIATVTLLLEHVAFNERIANVTILHYISVCPKITDI